MQGLVWWTCWPVKKKQKKKKEMLYYWFLRTFKICLYEEDMNVQHDDSVIPSKGILLFMILCVLIFTEPLKGIRVGI